MLQVQPKKKTPHLAVTHTAQGGSANQRHFSLVMKSVDELTPEQASLVNSIVSTDEKTEVEKSTYLSKEKALGAAVDARVKSNDRWSWSYVRDFDDSHVIYSSEGGVYAAPYTISGNEVTLGDSIAVNEMLSWEDSDGKIIASQSDNVSSEVKGLVIKSFDSPKLDNEKLNVIFKSRYEDEMEKENLQKENAELQSEIEKSNAQVKELQAQLDEIQKSQKEAQAAQRKEVVKSVTTEDNVEALFESLKDLDDKSFDTIVKSMESANALAQEKSGMFDEIQKSAKSEDVITETQLSALTKYIEKQQNK